MHPFSGLRLTLRTSASIKEIPLYLQMFVKYLFRAFVSKWYWFTDVCGFVALTLFSIIERLTIFSVRVLPS